MRRRYLCGALVGVLTTAAALSAGAGRSANVAHPSMKLAKPSVMRTFNGKPSKPGRPTRTTTCLTAAAWAESASKPRPRSTSSSGLAVEQRPVG